MKLSTGDQELESVIESELRSGENVNWVGRPERNVINPIAQMGTSMGAFFCLFGVIGILYNLFYGDYTLTAFMVLWTAIAAANLYEFSGALRAPNNQLYVLTNMRGIIIEQFRKGRIATINPMQLSSYEIRQEEELTTLHFGSKAHDQSFGWSPWLPLNAFYHIRDREAAEQHIHNLTETQANP